MSSPPSLIRRVFTVANLLSLVRIPLGALVWWRADSAVFVAVLMLVAGVSDLLDGAVARALAARRGETVADSGDIGAWLDPLCDKAFLVSVALAILVAHRPPTWLVLVLLTRDIVSITLLLAVAVRTGREGLGRIDYHAVLAGKLTTVLQFAAVLSVLFAPAASVGLALASGVVGAVAVAQVSWRERHAVTGAASVAGPSAR